MASTAEDRRIAHLEWQVAYYRRLLAEDTAAPAYQVEAREACLAKYSREFHARLSRREWLARARQARRNDGGTWGMRTIADCVEGARVWHRKLMAIRAAG